MNTFLTYQIISVVSFVLLSTLCLWVILYAKGHWLFKLPLIILSFAFVFHLESEMNNMLGWPSTRPAPEKFEFLHGHTVKPTKDDPGSVYLWIKSHDYWGAPQNLQLPYSEDLEEYVKMANIMRGKGMRVEGASKQSEDKKDGKNGYQARSDDDSDLGLIFYKLPPSHNLIKER